MPRWRWQRGLAVCSFGLAKLAFAFIQQANRVVPEQTGSFTKRGWP